MEMPEEQSRIFTDHTSKFLFCPTQTAVDNLKEEGIINGAVSEHKVFVQITKHLGKNNYSGKII